MKKALSILKWTGLSLLVFLIIALPIATLTNWWVRGFEPQAPVETENFVRPTEQPQPGASLKFMTYNIKFGGARINFFFDCYGDRVLMTEAEVRTNLEALAQKINKEDPDVLFLQEVDRGSDRVAGLDQLKILAELTGYPYAVYASQWDVSWVPSNGIGKVNSGNAILSKYPLKRSLRYRLPLIGEQPFWKRFFYLRRNILKSELLLPGDISILLYNTHLSAYTSDGTRKQQLEELYTLVIDAKENKQPVVFGGDLNTLPPGTKKFKDFDDSACEEEFVMDNYEQELNWLKPFYEEFSEVIPLNKYVQNESAYYSHTVRGDGFWNRRLDYLFSNGQWVPGSGQVQQEAAQGGVATMPLSDHAPVVGRLRLR